jgi:hypothetical protein
VRKARISGTVPWCSGLAYVPVKDEIAGSNPVGTAVSNTRLRAVAQSWLGRTLMIRPSRIATLNWRFRHGRPAVVAADAALA